MKDCNKCRYNTSVISEDGMQRKLKLCRECGGCPQEFDRDSIVPNIPSNKNQLKVEITIININS